MMDPVRRDIGTKLVCLIAYLEYNSSHHFEVVSGRVNEVDWRKLTA